MMDENLDTIIYKYQIPKFPATHTIELPGGAKILKVAKQNDDLCLWCEVPSSDDVRVPVPTDFAVRFTGHKFTWEEDMTFLNTVQIGNLVYHVYVRLHEDLVVW